MAKGSLIPAERIENAILLIRGHKVILDSDLAALYGVSTTRLNEQIKRNKEVSGRFHVPPNATGIQNLDIAICDIKFPMGRTTKAPVGVHGGRRRHGGHRAQ